MYRVSCICIHRSAAPGLKKKAHLHYHRMQNYVTERIDSNKLLHQNIIRPLSLLPRAHALATTTGGRPSGGRPRFLPVPPPPPVPAPVVAFFFFGVCACGCASPVGIVVATIAEADGATDTPNGLSKPALLNTGVAGCITPATTPDMTPTDTPARVVPAVIAPVAGPATTPAAAPSFSLVFFFDPPAAAMAALLGRITCPSGPSFA